MFLYPTIYLLVTYNLISLYIYFSLPKIFILTSTFVLPLLKMYFISGYLLAFYLFFISSTRVSNIIGLFLFILLPVLVICFIFIKNVFFFLFLYEYFLFPSILIVYLFSPNIRFLAANFYFIIWTQFGSLLVIIASLALYIKFNVFLFNDIVFILPNWLSLCILIGFGVKIPMWPFHFWLTKTHVEAPTFFSIYLSGFLVKTAVLGLIIFAKNINFSLIFLFLILSLVGVLDATIKFGHQIDLKKLVAYSTIQEMNMILIVVFLSPNNYLYLVLLFVITHTILSSVFFYIVDVVYKNHLSRTTTSVSGILNSNYFFGIIIITSVLLYLGFPYSVKFFVEIKLFLLLFSFNKVITLVVLFSVNWVGSILFGKIWLNIVFLKNSNIKHYFLFKKDILFFIFFFIFFILLTFLFLYF